MAELIPLLDPDADEVFHSSHAEQKIYKGFLNLPKHKTRDWVIFFSYYYVGKTRREHVNNEIDFLIVAPNVGIFDFEIKGGRIEVNNGSLYTINSRKERNFIDPYTQAKNNFYGLSTLLGTMRFGDEFLSLDKFVGGGLVGFPDISVLPDVGAHGVEKSTYVSGMDLYEFIIGFSDKLIARRDKRVPSKEDTDIILEKLKGVDFKYSMSKSEYIQGINLRLCDLTEEQKAVFHGLHSNPRCLITGGAGTGKTVLCQFLFNSLIEKKKSVIYLTFNRLIADKVSKSIDSNSSSACFPIMDYMEKQYCEIAGLDLSSMEYVEKKSFLFENAGKLLEDNKLNASKYDCLIVDEAQDIPLTDELVLFFMNLVNGDLENGSCYFFYDRNQNIIGNKKAIYESELFDEYRYTKFELYRNCRNSMGVDSAMSFLLKNIRNSKGFGTQGNMISNTDSFFSEISENEEGIEEIAENVRMLLEEGVQMNQIILVFSVQYGDFYKKLIAKLKAVPYKENLNKNIIRYTNIMAFKGMESDVILYINNKNNVPYTEHYVAISRARVLAYTYYVNRYKKNIE